MDEAMDIWMRRCIYGWGDVYMDGTMYMYIWMRRCTYICLGRFIYGWGDGDELSGFNAGVRVVVPPPLNLKFPPLLLSLHLCENYCLHI